MEGKESKRFTVIWHESPAQETSDGKIPLRLELLDMKKQKERVYKPAKVDLGGDHLMQKYIMPDQSDEEDEEEPPPSPSTPPLLRGEKEKCFRDEKPDHSNEPVTECASIGDFPSSAITRNRLRVMTQAKFKSRETENSDPLILEGLNSNHVNNGYYNPHKSHSLKEPSEAGIVNRHRENSAAPSSSANGSVSGITPRRSIALSRRLVELSSQASGADPVKPNSLKRASTKRKQTPSPIALSAGKSTPAKTNTPVHKRPRTLEQNNSSPVDNVSGTSITDESVIVATPIAIGRATRLFSRKPAVSNSRSTPKSPKPVGVTSLPGTSGTGIKGVSPIDSPLLSQTPRTNLRVKSEFARTHSTPNHGAAAPPDAIFDDSMEQYLSQIPLTQDCIAKKVDVEVKTSPSDSQLLGKMRTPNGRTPFQRYRTFPEPSTPSHNTAATHNEAEQSGMKSTTSFDDSLDCILSDPDLLAAIDAKCPASCKS